MTTFETLQSAKAPPRHANTFNPKGTDFIEKQAFNSCEPTLAPEVYWMRCIACLLVFTHHYVGCLDFLPPDFRAALRVPTSLGTPTFLFISTFLFEFRYPSRPPANFLRRRFQYLLPPYVTYGILFSALICSSRLSRGEDLDVLQVLTNTIVFAKFHGWFLLVSLQFALFFVILRRHYTRPGRFSSILLNPIATGLISAFYWMMTVDGAAPGNVRWIAPLGWIYIFSLGRVVASRYACMISRLHSCRFLLVVFFVASVLAIGLARVSTEFSVSSKEPWIVALFPMFLASMLALFANHSPSRVVLFVNKYSFGIFLAHPFFLIATDQALKAFQFAPPTEAALLAVVGFGGPIVMNALVNKIPGGAMLFGKTLVVRR